MTFTYTTAFTRTHAKYLASKVVADLYLCSLVYGRPASASIESYEEELVTLLAGRYVATYEFGFKRSGKRVLSWFYSVGTAGDLDGDIRSGGLVRGIDVSSALYFNFMTHTDAWFDLSVTDRKAIEDALPFQRSAGSEPGDGDGYWATERRYAAGGVLVERRVFRPW